MWRTRGSQRPFAVHVLTGIGRRHYEFVVFRHPDAHRDEIDIRVVRQLACIAERERNLEVACRLDGMFLSRGARGDDLELGKRPKCRDMRHRPPAAIGIQPDDAKRILSAIVLTGSSPSCGGAAACAEGKGKVRTVPPLASGSPGATARTTVRIVRCRRRLPEGRFTLDPGRVSEATKDVA